MTILNTAKAATASKAIIKNCAKPSPMPSEWASQARPRPAARPPSMAPQGFLGAAAGAAAGAPGLAGAVAAFWVGAVGDVGGVALRWVTLLDCWPNDLPPPMRLASASGCSTIKTATNRVGKSFFITSLLDFNI